MPITRRDIVSKVFTSVGGGYDADEVDTFLDLVADTLELRDDALRTERQRSALLAAEIRRLDAQAADLRKASARAENADAEARELLEQAKLQARMVISAAREEAGKIVKEATDQAELIVRKSTGSAAGRFSLSERIAGYALRPVGLEPAGMAGKSADLEEPAAHSAAKAAVFEENAGIAGTTPPQAAGSGSGPDAIAETPPLDKGDLGAAPAAAQEGSAPGGPDAETLPPADDPAFGVRGNGGVFPGNEAETLADEPGGERKAGEPFPGNGQAGDEASAAPVLPAGEQGMDEAPPFAAEETAGPPMPSEFPKAERPAESRPRLEIQKPPRPEDVYDEAEGFYPPTDWLKDPDSRYET